MEIGRYCYNENMPEAYVSAGVEIKKKSSVCIVRSGIGDSDGFPLFDNGEDDTYSTPDDPKWGFRITGGSEFKMPITVFQVTEGGLAAKGGIKLGDIILEVNGTDTKNLTLTQAHEIIDQADSNLHLIASKMEEDDGSGNVPEEKSIVLRSTIPKDLQPPREFVPPPQAERKVWHPVMWNHPPPTDTNEIVPGMEPPHHRIIRNIRRFFKDTEDKPELRQKYIEDMLLALPSASKI